MSFAPLPAPLAAPAWAPAFRTDSLEAVRNFIGQRDGPAFRVARRGEPLGYALYTLRGAGSSVGGSESAVGQTVLGTVLGQVLVLALPPGTVYRAGRRSLAPTAPDAVVTLPPLWDVTRTSPPGHMFAVEVQGQALDAELQARRGRGQAMPAHRLAVHRLAPAARQQLVAAAADLIHSKRPGAAPALQAQADARFVELMAGLWLQDPGKARPGALALARVRDLEDWIDAHLGEPITLGRLCAVAGVGERSLQQAFEHRRGLPPMQFLLHRRLLAAQQRLSGAAGQPGVTVTDTALAVGLTHLGRFALSYRQLLGEPPSQTLGRHRG